MGQFVKTVLPKCEQAAFVEGEIDWSTVSERKRRFIAADTNLVRAPGRKHDFCRYHR